MSPRALILPLIGLFGCPKPDGASAPGEPEIMLQSVRFEPDSGTIYVEAKLEPGTLQGRDKPVYLGVTAVTPDGVEIDLMVNELFPAALGEPVVFYAEIGGEVRDLLIGAWDQKIAPCDVDRSGCRQFGFVLDGPLASWPPGLYTEGVRQRIPPASVRLRVEGDAAGAARAAEKALSESVAPFGSTVSVVTGDVPPAAGVVQVRYADDHDLLLARRIAAAIGKTLGVEPEILRAPLGEDHLAVAIGER